MIGKQQPNYLTNKRKMKRGDQLTCDGIARAVANVLCYFAVRCWLSNTLVKCFFFKSKNRYLIYFVYSYFSIWVFLNPVEFKNLK